jgi:NAD(P)-dependent dehydrogenase (short-subunit alcohol dehydrogenase family)
LSERGSGADGLEGQAALVTGASSGLGRAVAIALARAGADVALIARSEKDLRETEELVFRTGRRALVLPTDLASATETRGAMERTVESFGRVDVLVNAAGTDAPGPVVDLEVEGWDRTLEVNLRAPFLLSKAAFPHMREAGGGTIVNVSSVAGKKGWANASAYCASKFGLTGFTEALAEEGRPHGIRAIVIYPGAMATNWGAWSPEERHKGEAGQTSPMRALPPSRVADRFHRPEVRELLPRYLLGLLGEAPTTRKLERPGEESRSMRICMSDTPTGKSLQRSPTPPCE